MSDQVRDSILGGLERSRQLTDELLREVRKYHDTKPHEIKYREDRQLGKRIYYCSATKPVPRLVSAVAADIVQNLRSPLDQLAYQLVLAARGGVEPTWKVYFPIAPSAAAYPGTRKGAIKGIAPAVIEAIDAIEPFKGGNGHGLWQLNALNKSNKHTLVVASAPVPDGVDVSPEIKGFLKTVGASQTEIDRVAPLWIMPADRPPLRVGDGLFGEPLDHGPLPDRQFRFNVQLNAPDIIEERESALGTFTRLSKTVSETVDALMPFLP